MTGAARTPRRRPRHQAWDLPAAYEAMARASFVAGNLADAAAWKARATAALAQVADPEDRTVIEADLATIAVEATG